MEDLSKRNGKGQTILFFNLRYFVDKHIVSAYVFAFLKPLEQLQKNGNYDVIMFCYSRYKQYFEMEQVLPRNRYVVDHAFNEHNPPNIHLNRVLYDLALNPSYDRFDSRLGYYEELKTQCSKSTIYIVFYSGGSERLRRIYFLRDALLSRFPSLRIQVQENVILQSIMRRYPHYRPIIVDLGIQPLEYFNNYEKKIRVLVEGDSKDDSPSDDGTASLRTTEEDLYSVKFFNELVEAINVILCR